MKDIRSIHNRAMEFMRAAKQDLETRNKEGYLKNTKAALDLEQTAAYALLSSFESEPTRSVLFRSAANLAYNIGEYSLAEKLIYQALSGSPHAEIKAELLLLKDSIELAIGLELSANDITEYSYINIIKEHAVNLKVEPKTEKYSKAVVLDSIIDFLKNVQTSYKNFAEVLFRKSFDSKDYFEYDKTLTYFKRDSNLLMVDLKFQSFGVALVADTSIMNYRFDLSSKFTEFKSTIFDNFKRDVLFADFNSEKFQQEIGEKYSDSERSKIYSTILNSLDNKSEYKVSISDKNFKFKVKDMPTVTKKTLSFFKPRVAIQEGEERDLFIKRTMELTDVEGNKKTKLQTEYLSYAEFLISISDIKCKEPDISIYFIEPYDVKIIFQDSTFSINDSFFEINVDNKNFKEVQKSYESALVEKYLSLFKLDNLTVDENDLLDKMNSSFLVS